MGGGDTCARDANFLALSTIVLEEHLFAADTAQDSKTRHGVGSQRGQASRGFALGGLGRVEGLHKRRGECSKYRHAQEHDQTELHRSREQDNGYDNPRHYGAGESCKAVVGTANTHRVGGDGVDDVARRYLVGQGRARRGDVAADDLNRAERRAHPVGYGELVAHRTTERLNDAQHDDDRDPLEKLGVATVFDAVVYRRAHRRPHERLGDHPADSKEGVERQ